ncbi:nucleotide sugar dehydrogenase [Paenibacillus xerothermodurans]|uniref:Nucleotide sugar dehydrogenase n=1 Tax=Paenibacillus xerothermodurans TaxID=1977292 RepID=A0A2W1P1X0_PAEXE|nr:nucleotide sugar dehydrogenase [Paenibacillus xerothermodurans]PZE21128.1 nucleotide sugar dehydrogenase [Paenibacillus xerothermodurans]
MDEITQPLRISVIGLGYVGLPLAMLFVDKQHHVIGVDLDAGKISRLKAGRSYISDLTDEQVSQLMQSGKFEALSDYRQIPPVNVFVICVPTPLNRSGNPELTYIERAGTEIAQLDLQGQLVILESSTYPGTTEELLLPILERGGREVGRDFYLAYSPERFNPGAHQFQRTTMPKIVSGVTQQCLQKVSSLYSSIFDTVVPVSSTHAAEMVKVLENSQRFLNISFLNAVVKFCEAMHIDIWEVIDAIHTKPYGNLDFYPGPGIGGHCIPVDPMYLEWKAAQVGVPLPHLQISKHINDTMPLYLVGRLKKILSEPQLKDASILLLGLTYKKDVSDLRESSSMEIFSILVEEGADVSYHDPLVPEVQIADKTLLSVDLAPELLSRMDCVVLLTDHSSLPLESIVLHSKLLFDTRNAVKSLGTKSHVVRL